MSDHVERAGEVVGFERGMARVRLERPAAACGSCGSRGSCAAGAAGEVIRMHLPEATRLGDRIVVSTPAASLALAGLLGYALPAASLLAGAVLAASFFDGDGAAVLGGALGFLAGLLAARLISRFTIGPGLAASVCKPDSTSGEHP